MVAVVIRILELMHEALRTGAVISKRSLPQHLAFLHLADGHRDIYYRDPALFASQACVDRYVDDIAYSFSVPRSHLNVTAAAKGLITGAARFCRRDGSNINVSRDREGMLVPSLREVRSLAASRCWIRLTIHRCSLSTCGP